MLRILIADDHTIVRDGIKALLAREADLLVVGEAANGFETLQKTALLKPDLVLLDLSMPLFNGLQAAKALARDHPQVKILVLTAHEDQSYFIELCKAHASGYIVKRTASTQLLQAIRKVADGQIHFDESLAGKAINDLAYKSAEQLPAHDGWRLHLSDREEEVLRGVAWGFTNKELASRLGLSVKTIETHKVRICGKLGLRSRAEMVQYAVRQGWLSETRSLPQLSD
jgi:DNA-binding NarL/FixJ family response regulator